MKSWAASQATRSSFPEEGETESGEGGAGGAWQETRLWHLCRAVAASNVGSMGSVSGSGTAPGGLFTFLVPCGVTPTPPIGPPGGRRWRPLSTVRATQEQPVIPLKSGVLL